MSKAQYIAIEAGGTKFVLATGSGPDDLCDRVVIPTTTPDETMPEIIEYIAHAREQYDIRAIGAGVFGPLDPDPQSPRFGYITSTPKREWRQFNFVGYLNTQTGLPVAFDTDVNAALMGEARWGAARGLSDFIYMTVGTGIGGGVMTHGNIVHGAMHTEMGHILMPKRKDDQRFDGVCPFHGDCLEGLASGPSILKRWAVSEAAELSSDHAAWDLESHYLAVACANYTFCLSPKRIILGGGVMSQPGLIEKIREKTLKAIAGYVSNPTVTEGIAEYIVLPGLGDDAGILGAIALAAKEENVCVE